MINNRNSENKLLTFYGEYCLKYWIDLMINKKITLPKYQRKFVWSPFKMRELLMSLNNRLYVPPVLIANNTLEGDRKNYVLDGQQRLTTILLFYLGVFPKFEIKSKNSVDWKDEWIGSWDLRDLVNVFYNEDKLFDYYMSNDLNHIKEVLVNSNCYIAIESDELKKFLSPYQIELNDCYKVVMDKDNFNEMMLGYSYVRYEEPNEEKELETYAHIFRVINSTGEKLTDLQTRKALYGVRKIPNSQKTFDEYFAPNSVENIDYDGEPLDFASLLAYVTEYRNRESKNNREFENVAVGYGYSGQREQYFYKYVTDCIADSNSERFGRFSEIVNYSPDSIDRMFNYFKEIYSMYIKYYNQQIDNKEKERVVNNKYKIENIIELQYLFFGLIYWVIFKNQELIYKERLNELVKKLYDNIKEQKKSLSFKQYNQIGQVRIRLRDSIKVYSIVFKIGLF